MGTMISEETRRKLSEAQKGRYPSEETRRRMSESRKGKHASDETKKRMSEAQKGRHPSEEARKNMRLAKKGVIPKVAGWNRGIPHTVETKRKISIAEKGRKFSKETRKKISEAKKGANSYLWKGGITPLTRQIRHCFEYRQWRSDCFTRDDFTCQRCGKRGEKLSIDHYPKGFAEIFHQYNIKTLQEALDCEEFWNINNGVTVCWNKVCHPTH